MPQSRNTDYTDRPNTDFISALSASSALSAFYQLSGSSAASAFEDGPLSRLIALINPDFFSALSASSALSAFYQLSASATLSAFYPAPLLPHTLPLFLGLLFRRRDQSLKVHYIICAYRHHSPHLRAIGYPHHSHQLRAIGYPHHLRQLLPISFAHLIITFDLPYARASQPDLRQYA